MSGVTNGEQSANAQLYAIVQDWPQGLPLQVEEIDLADVLAYDLLRILGRMFLNQAAPSTAENENDQARLN